MGTKNYNVITTERTARPRSKRLRAIGTSTSTVTVVSGGSGSSAVSGGGATEQVGHTHANQAVLDSLSLDNEDYLYITQVHDEEETSTTQKVKAGLSDEAGHAAEADHATNADKAATATEANHAAAADKAKTADEADHAAKADHATNADKAAAATEANHAAAADKAKTATEADHAASADKAATADKATDSEKWAGHTFGDYLDQALRTTDKVRFAQLIADVLATPGFKPGMAGTGAQIDRVGNAELDSLTLRRFLEVPELRYNRVDVTMGDKWSAPAAGIIESVDTENKVITLHLEDGEVGSAAVGDLCMGIYHATSGNATTDSDDSRGNRRFAGFSTCYFWITAVSGADNSLLSYALRPVSDTYPVQVEPMPMMHFVGYGNVIDPARQTARYETRTYQRYLKGVSSWEFSAANIAAQFGDLSNLAVHGLQMEGYSAYLDNIYMQGILRSLDGTFVADSRTKSLLLASSETGTGLAFNPTVGLRIGSVYDPATGKFRREYDLAEMSDAINDAASDSALTALEKQAARKELDTIDAERPELLMAAAQYGVPTADYAAAYDALHAYLDPLLADMTATSAVVGDDYRNAFTAYAQQKAALQASITEATKALLAYSVAVYSTSGNSFIGKVDTDLQAQVMCGAEDITAEIPAGYFSWFRRSLNTDGDNVWNQLHEGVGSAIHITGEDVVRSAVFECQVNINGVTYSSI